MKKITKILLCSFIFLSITIQAETFQSHFERADSGQAITDQERTQATDELIGILKDTNYFDFIDSRVHGIPENDPKTSFWWASMWTGVRAFKKNGKVTYVHSNDGTDNAGIHTPPYLEGACYGYQLTKDPKLSYLARKLMRGMSAWLLSSAKSADDKSIVLSRAFYPESRNSFEDGKEIFINYDANRPGINGVPSGYVHIPNNPVFGDIWLKHKRSIDDIGHMIRSIAQVQSCREAFDDEAKKDLEQMNILYAAWAQDVEAHKYIIPFYNFAGEVYTDRFGLGDYNTFKLFGIDPDCPGKLAIHYLHSNSSGKLKCGRGISLLEKIGNRFLKNDAIEILRSHHVAAVAMAELRNQSEVANKLREGIAKRMTRDMHVLKNIKLSPLFDRQDIPTFFINANNVGVPMTSEEIRFVYQKLHDAYLGMRSPVYFSTYHLFDSSVPDGEYPFDPPNIALYHRIYGLMLGSCTSTFRNPNGRQFLDCERLKKSINY
jgi:hypothetical protein